MRKLIMLAAALALVATMAAAPALADDGSDQFSASGDVNQSFDVSGGGDNSNTCNGVQGVANTGSVQNQANLDLTDDVGLNEDLLDALDDNDLSDNEFDDLVDLLDDQSDSHGDFDFSQDGSIDVSPVNITDCNQSVDQTATANG